MRPRPSDVPVTGGFAAIELGVSNVQSSGQSFLQLHADASIAWPGEGHGDGAVRSKLLAIARATDLPVPGHRRMETREGDRRCAHVGRLPTGVAPNALPVWAPISGSAPGSRRHPSNRSRLCRDRQQAIAPALVLGSTWKGFGSESGRQPTLAPICSPQLPQIQRRCRWRPGGMRRWHSFSG